MPVDALSAGALGAAIAVAVAHTALGPDHYVPFVMLSRARRWSLRRTLLVTCACGVGHLGSSLLLGTCGLAAGAALGHVEALELARGGLAGWALLAFGLAYFLWGLRRGLCERRALALHTHHGHVHLHAGGALGHTHSHATEGHGTTFWTLFLVFVLGPCEPLIPLFLVPASEGRWSLAAAMAIAFSVATLASMLLLTALALRGVERLPLGRVERWLHAASGVVIALSGAAVLLGA